MDDGKVEKVIGGVDQGAGLRLIHDLRTADAHTNDLSREGLLPLTKDLSALAAGPRVTPIAARRLEPGRRYQVLKPPKNVTTSAKVELVRAANAAARGVDNRGRQVRVMYLERVQKVRVVNTLGVEAWDKRVHLVLVVHCRQRPNAGRLRDCRRPGGPKVARQAVMMLGTRPAPGGAMPVVCFIAAPGALWVHEAGGHGLEADLVLEGITVYQNKIGQQVAAPWSRLSTTLTCPASANLRAWTTRAPPAARTCSSNGRTQGLHERSPLGHEAGAGAQRQRSPRELPPAPPLSA
ncbi:hypothetical protein DFAR_2040011 [Desulfarculales bacterium]